MAEVEDFCGACGHSRVAHGGGECIVFTDDPEGPVGGVWCACEEFEERVDPGFEAFCQEENEL